MKSVMVAATLAASMIVTGCASMKKSIALGAGSGAATGAASGALIGREDKGKAALTGALFGGLLGGVASFFIHKGVEDRDEKVRKQTLFNLDQYGVSGAPAKIHGDVPGITFPVENEEQIPTHRKGNRVIEQHRIWTLSDNAKFKGESKKRGEKSE